jgi:hypothetical protein
MKLGIVVWAVVVTAVPLFAAIPAVAAIEEIPEKRMVSEGGVLYPQTGDSSQERFQTPQNATTMFPPGTLVGVLPADCISASSGAAGSYYRCDHDFALKEQLLQDGRTVYLVIEKP